ncbi:McrB family protein [Paractinoplanes globisporus]|uniref:McrB family protein n=1 Tax=Paractinoplanes globisporus TaxID=113565 RepID=A0ABW6W645_9ACTN|nr:AAA family ATPase [Actinoplanes globisporus]
MTDTRPPLSDLRRFVDWWRDSYEPASLVESRRRAEQQARELLDEFAGTMTADQALELGRLFNTGEWGGAMKHNRFTPAFVGATMSRVIDPLDQFNQWTERLWRRPIDESLSYVDEILKNVSAFPGAGRSYPTMLMYLRDPDRFAIWLQITHQGLATLGRLDESRGRGGGVERYLRYCEAAQRFAADFGLAPQEIDAVLAEIGRPQPVDDFDPPPMPRPLAEVAERTHLPLEQLEEWVALFQGSKKQALLYGPPGTGKTFVAEEIGLHLAGPDGKVETVQFHPSFSYEDFIEGLRPVSNPGGTIGYEVRPGIFKRFCEDAKNSTATHVFIIDEINRAELGAVLGELMMLLEYRVRKSVLLPYSQERFFVPENVVVLATMNTADRSLALVDFALRRRFHALEMRPSRDVLSAHLGGGESADLVLEFFDLVQREVDNRDFAPGHSYWMGDDATAAGLYRIWRYELYPYLSEYWFEHRSRLNDLDAKVTKMLSEEA